MSLTRLMKITLLIAALLVMGSAPAMAGLVEYNLSVDTLALQGLGSFSLAFQLGDGSGLGDGNNIVNLYNFNFGGGSTGPSPEFTFGGASGSLLSGVALTDTDPVFNALVQSFMPGSQLTFHIALTNNPDPGQPDLFTISLLDGAGNGVPTLDANGYDSLFTVALDGSPVPAFSAWATDPGRTAFVVPAGSVEFVPEPASLVLFGLGLAGVACLRRKRQA